MLTYAEPLRPTLLWPLVYSYISIDCVQRFGGVSCETCSHKQRLHRVSAEIHRHSNGTILPWLNFNTSVLHKNGENCCWAIINFFANKNSPKFFSGSATDPAFRDYPDSYSAVEGISENSPPITHPPRRLQLLKFHRFWRLDSAPRHSAPVDHAYSLLYKKAELAQR